MDVKLFIESLSSQEKVNIFYALKPIVEKEETIDEFIHNKDISVALFNVLKGRYRSGTRLVSEINKNEFMEIRGAGEKRWAEFIKARGF